MAASAENININIYKVPYEHWVDGNRIKAVVYVMIDDDEKIIGMGQDFLESLSALRRPADPIVCPANMKNYPEIIATITIEEGSIELAAIKIKNRSIEYYLVRDFEAVEMLLNAASSVKTYSDDDVNAFMNQPYKDELNKSFSNAIKSGEINPMTFFNKIKDTISAAETTFLEKFENIPVTANDYSSQVNTLINNTSNEGHSRGLESKLKAMQQTAIRCNPDQENTPGNIIKSARS